MRKDNRRLSKRLLTLITNQIRKKEPPTGQPRRLRYIILGTQVNILGGLKPGCNLDLCDGLDVSQRGYMAADIERKSFLKPNTTVLNSASDT